MSFGTLSRAIDWVLRVTNVFPELSHKIERLSSEKGTVLTKNNLFVLRAFGNQHSATVNTDQEGGGGGSNRGRLQLQQHQHTAAAAPFGTGVRRGDEHG